MKLLEDQLEFRYSVDWNDLQEWYSLSEQDMFQLQLAYEQYVPGDEHQEETVSAMITAQLYDKLEARSPVDLADVARKLSQGKTNPENW